MDPKDRPDREPEQPDVPEGQKRPEEHVEEPPVPEGDEA